MAAGADAIVGVNFFSEMDAEDFGRFDRVFYGLFKILGGETWFEALDEVPPNAPPPGRLTPRRARSLRRR